MNNKKITSHQLFALSALSTLGGSILVVTSIMTGIAGQDAWISVLVTMVLGLLLMWVYTFLVTRFEKLTFIGVTRKIFGKWIGTVVSAGYFLYIFVTSYDIPWYIGSFHTHIMHETPVIIILIVFYAALVIAALYGIEAIARASEIFFVFVTVTFIISIVLILPEVKVQYILPVFENGTGSVLKAAVVLSGYISLQNTTLLMIYPASVDNEKQGKKALINGFLWANTVVLITVLVSILVLGSLLLAKSAFPTILLAREIIIGTILTRLEYAISIMWTISEFVIAALYFYAGIVAFSELVGLKSHKNIILPMGLLGMMMTISGRTETIEKGTFIPGVFLPNVITFGLLMPVIMLIVYFVRKALNRRLT